MSRLFSYSSRTWRALIADEAGFIITAELVLIATICVLGLVVGLNYVRCAINGELKDLAWAFGSLNQSYAYSGFHGCRSNKCGLHSFTAGSGFYDEDEDVYYQDGNIAGDYYYGSRVYSAQGAAFVIAAGGIIVDINAKAITDASGLAIVYSSGLAIYDVRGLMVVDASGRLLITGHGHALYTQQGLLIIDDQGRYVLNNHGYSVIDAQGQVVIDAQGKILNNYNGAVYLDQLGRIVIGLDIAFLAKIPTATDYSLGSTVIENSITASSFVIPAGNIIVNHSAGIVLDTNGRTVIRNTNQTILDDQGKLIIDNIGRLIVTGHSHAILDEQKKLIIDAQGRYQINGHGFAVVDSQGQAIIDTQGQIINNYNNKVYLDNNGHIVIGVPVAYLFKPGKFLDTDLKSDDNLVPNNSLVPSTKPTFPASPDCTPQSSGVNNSTSSSAVSPSAATASFRYGFDTHTNGLISIHDIDRCMNSERAYWNSIHRINSVNKIRNYYSSQAASVIPPALPTVLPGVPCPCGTSGN